MNQGEATFYQEIIYRKIFFNLCLENLEILRIITSIKLIVKKIQTFLISS